MKIIIVIILFLPTICVGQSDKLVEAQTETTTDNVNLKQYNIDIFTVQGKIEKDYFNVLSLVFEYKENGITPSIEEKNKNNLVLASQNIDLLGQFDHEDEPGKVILEILYQIVESYNYLKFSKVEDLNLFKNSLIELNKRNNSSIDSINKIINHFKKI